MLKPKPTVGTDNSQGLQINITFGNNETLTCFEINAIKEQLEREHNIASTIYPLHRSPGIEPAYLLIVRGLIYQPNVLYTSLKALNWDNKIYTR